MCNYKRCTVLPVCKKEMPSPCGKRCNELKNGDISDILASMETHFKQRNETNGRNSNDISGFGAFRGQRKALEKKGYGYPTSVQREAIPPLLAWKDVIAKAPTGTGKTFAFGHSHD